MPVFRESPIGAIGRLPAPTTSDERTPASMRAFVGHPVDVISGGVYTAWNDFEFKGRTPVTSRRFYSTGVNEITAHGLGWTTEYFARLERQGEGLVLTGNEGHAHRFA